jgi:zinc-binding alcohol dehydrogenase/oxidoreductase
MMQALVFTGVDQPLRHEQRADPLPGDGEVVIELKAAALNRRDYWITQGKYPGIRTPVVLGSDGAGIVALAGPGVSGSWVGREVLLYPARDWGERPSAQGPHFRILGMPDDGTFATAIVVPASMLYARPPHLSWQEAAALPLAGLTAYRAVFVQGRLHADQRVLISGVGGGVATFALQFALASGARVWVTSSSPRKIQHALSLGAAAGFDYREPGWSRQLLADSGPLDLIVDGAGGPGYRQLLEVAAPAGRIVNYGATAGRPPELDLFPVFWKQLHLIGSTMGSPQDFEAMLDFVQQHRIRPVIDQVFPLDDADLAIRRMEHSPQFGKLVLNCNI